MKRKNIFKSLLGAAMALIMIFGAAPLSGFVGIRLPMLSLKAEAATTEDGLFEYEVYNYWPSSEPKGVTILSYKGPDSGEVVIPKTIEGYAVKKISDRAFQNCTGITSVVIPDGVMIIGEFVFSGCTSLAEIVIPDSVTGIGEWAFSGCTSLAEITIPDSVTSIGGYAFSDCTSLTEIVIPDSVTSIGVCAFSGCTSLSKVDLPKNLTGIYSGVFSGCTSLTEITIPDSVTSIGGSAFSGCTSLAEITVSPNNKNYSSVAGVLFNKDVSELIVYPKGNGRSAYTVPDGVTSIGGSAFSGCTSLAEIVIPDSVTSIGDSAFSGCTSLAEIVIPDSVTSIGVFAFSGCTSLSKVDLPKTLTTIEAGTFRDCTSLKEIVIPDSVTEIRSNWGYDRCDGAFSGCTSLSKVDLPKKLTTIEAGTFRDCTSLKEIVIPDSVTEIRCNWDLGAFSGCTSLSKVKLSNNLTIIDDRTFSDCTSLAEIDIPDSVTSIGRFAFSGCTSLSKVDLPKKLTTIEAGTFRDCTSLKEIVIPDSVTEIRSKWEYNGCYGAFSNCTSLESITIGRGVESLGDEWIASCRRLENITVSPENKTYSSVDGVLFNKDKSELSAYPIGNKRSSYTIPDGVEKIGKKAFYGCRYIESLTIPVSVAEIEASALGNCYDIRAVYYLGTREQWKEVVIGADNYMFALVNVRCADDSQCRHVWGEWEVVEEATYEKDGLERRVCSLCKAEQTRKIPRLGAVKVDAIELSESEKKLNVGKSFTITATVKPDNAWNRTVTWSSSDPSIATVDENGTVTAIAEGEAIITAESADGVTAECKVTVEKKESFGKKLLNVITAPFRAIINLFKKLFGK